MRKLTGIKFGILCFFLYVLLPCGIDVQCEEDDAILNICSFRIDDVNTQFSRQHYYDGKNVYNRFHCNTKDFELFLREVLKEVHKLKEKNVADINKGIGVAKRGDAFNKRVLVVNRSQIETVFKELGDVIGCQECPQIIFCDCEKNEIKNYNDLHEFYSNFSKNDKRNVENKQSDIFNYCSKRITDIFADDKTNFNYITEYYTKNYEKYDSIIEQLFVFKRNIISEIKQHAKETEGFISANDFCQEVLSFSAIYEEYKNAENKILNISLNHAEYKELFDALENYAVWRSILLQAQVIKTFIDLLGNESIVNKNKELIKECVKQETMPDEFEEHYTEYFFEDYFKDAKIDEYIEQLKTNPFFEMPIRYLASKHKEKMHDDFSFDSWLDLFMFYLKNKNFLSQMEKSGNFNVLNRFLENLKKDNFTTKASALFKIVKIGALCNGAGFDEKAFYQLDEKIKDHFNSIIFNYLNGCFGRVKTKLKNVGGGITYDFHNANIVYEIIRIISSYIGPFLDKKEGRSELIYNIIPLLMEEMKTLSVSSDINGILMECCLVLNTLMEYFIYVKDYNAYIKDEAKNRELMLKKNNLSNKLDNFCVIGKKDYDRLCELANTHNDEDTPEVIDAVAQRVYEEAGKEGNNPLLKLVVMGNMRAGKTLLVRSLFKEEERFKFKVANGDTSTTSKINFYKRMYGEDKYIQIVDTPGFEYIGRREGDRVDRGYEAINGSFNNLFAQNNTIVLDIVLFKEGCIDWLSENHKDIITQILKDKKNKIIFLIPFTGFKKNAKKIKEKFLASLFYNLYIRDEDFPITEVNLHDIYKDFVEKVIAIPINQFYSDEDGYQESRFGLKEMGNVIMNISKNYVNDEFRRAFIETLPDDKLCEDDKEDEVEYERIDDNNEKDDFNNIINDENEKTGSLKHLISELLEGFNGFKLKIDESKENESKKDKSKENESKKDKSKENESKIDENIFWYHDDTKSYELLKYIYMFYSLFSWFIELFVKESSDPLIYEIHKTGMYKIAEFIKSPYFFNYLCLDNKELGYNLFFFKPEIELINKKEFVVKALDAKKKLAHFCLVADNPFLINEEDYNTIKNLCVKFNSNYEGIKPLSSVKNAMESNYEEIKNQLVPYFSKNNNIDIDTKFLDFVVCFDPKQKRYILDRTNLRFLGFDLPRHEDKLYEKIPGSLKWYIKNLNAAMSGIESYDDFENKIQDKNNDFLYKRYHHEKQEELIRKRERECINVVFKAIQKKKQQEEEKKNGGLLGFIKNPFSFFNSLHFNQKMDETIKKTKNAWENNKLINKKQDQ